jgi:hypothetical protein
MESLRGKLLVPLAVILLGAGLRVGVFLVNRSLSIDEAALCRILIERSWTGLVGPLDYAQVEPPGFLFVQKSALSLFGNSEAALRLFPLLCGIGSLWLMWAVLRRIVTLLPTVIGLTLFAVSPSLIDYSARAKQYSTEVAASIVVLLVAINLFRGQATTKRAFWLGALGALMSAFSFSVVFMLIAAAATSAIAAMRNREVAWPLLIAAAWWSFGAAFGVVVGRFSMTSTDALYMNWFWEAGFMPFSLGWRYDIAWLWHRLLGVFSFTAQYRAPWGWLGLWLLGIWSLERRGLQAAALLLALPMALTMIAAVFHQYPLQWGRIELFLLPAVMILVAEGVEWCRRLSDGRTRWLCTAPAAIVLILGVSSVVANREAFDDAGVKQALRYVKSNWRPADHLYVYHGDAQQFLYYADRFHLASADYTLGECSRGADRRYLQEIDGLRGRSRVWLLLSRDDVEAGVLMKYLDTVGVRLDGVDVKPSNERGYWATAFARLYDLTGSARSAAVSASAYELPDELDRTAPFPWTCYGVFSPFVHASSR